MFVATETRDIIEMYVTPTITRTWCPTCLDISKRRWIVNFNQISMCKYTDNVNICTGNHNMKDANGATSYCLEILNTASAADK